MMPIVICVICHYTIQRAGCHCQGAFIPNVEASSLPLFILSAKKMRWCTVSDPEQRKCAELAKALLTVLPPAAVSAFAKLSCVRASSTSDCIERIRVSGSAAQ